MQNPTIQKNQSKVSQSKKYQIISYQTRRKLIDLVVKHGKSVFDASCLVGIKNATAKVIIRKYRQEGAIFKRKGEKIRKYMEKKQSLIEKKDELLIVNSQDVIEHLPNNFQFNAAAFPGQTMVYYCIYATFPSECLSYFPVCWNK